MQIFVERIVNNPVDSNCFIVYSLDYSNCIVVDPGSYDCIEIIKFIERKKLNPKYIILTHEHFDHIWGVNKLKLRYNANIISSALCSEKLVNSKKNMSFFFDGIGFETYPCDISIESVEDTLYWNDIKIDFMKTPGHTDCSISFFIGNRLFVGDLIIMGHKTVTKLPSGNKNLLLKSLNFIFNKNIELNIEIYPGHGDIFMLNDVDISRIF